MDGQSLDVTAEKIAQLRAIFPEVFSENKIDFARLKDILGESVVFPNEHYELSWAGKAEARREIQKQTTATLIPDKENSVDFDAAGNIFIEGENLEVLWVLQKSYFGKVKMIYIDPPYNTGNDSFVYPDDYAERQADYNKRTGITNGDGDLNRQDLWRKNTRENGQFHSVWLSMMYPRLYLARNLLREDGLIFVSCDDNEAATLKLLLDEVFGEENFIGEFIWHSRQNVDSRSLTGASIDHEYVLCYSKSLDASIQGKQINKDKYSNPDNDSRGPWMSSPMDGVATRDRRPNLHYTIVHPATELSYEPSPNTGWRFQRSTVEQLIAENRVLWPRNPNSKPRFKRYLNELSSEFTGFSTMLDVDYTAKATQELRQIMGMETLKFPKPLSLLKVLIQQGLNGTESSLVLDFFAGSGTTAQAVLELNEEDGGNRQFVCVQMPEPLEEGSEAYKAGYRTIADICKARIQKVIAQLQTARAGKLPLETNPQPLGFQAFRLAPSNFKAWRGDVTGEDILKQLELHIHSEKQGSEGEKMLYELLLKAGYPLTAKVESAEIDGQAVYTVEDGKILVFFDDYTPAINAYVHQQKPQRVVCLDRVFKGNDEALTNFKLKLKEAGIELKII
ncbi:site-specific DNA-methyltransferase [Candidatus Poribacteria bacterium]|nr:site-specific DNA-methyltransferase [Candidatus Poribacteria bacterium]